MHWLGHRVRGMRVDNRAVFELGVHRTSSLLWMQHRMGEMSLRHCPLQTPWQTARNCWGSGKCPCTLPWPEMFPCSPGHSTQGTLLL